MIWTKEQYKEFSANLRHLRERRNLKASYAARQIGVSKNRLYSWEAGRSAPQTPALYLAISDFYEVPVDAFLRGDIRQFDFRGAKRGRELS